jgi:hypothetical protein
MSHAPDRNTRNKIQILYFVLYRNDLKHLTADSGAELGFRVPKDRLTLTSVSNRGLRQLSLRAPC